MGLILLFMGVTEHLGRRRDLGRSYLHGVRAPRAGADVSDLLTQDFLPR